MLHAALLTLGVLACAFLISGVVPAYIEADLRARRVRLFRDQYRAVVEGRANPAELEWLTARRREMQEDAKAVGLGVLYISPSSMAGGGPYLPWLVFADLWNEQSHTEDYTPEQRDDLLATVLHDVERVQRDRRWDLYNPVAWLRIAFERLIRLPRYLLRQAGFSQRTVEGTPARILTLLWSGLIGLSGIGGFVIALLTFLREN